MSRSLEQRLEDAQRKLNAKKSGTNNNGKKDEFPEAPNKNLDYPAYLREKKDEMNKER